MSTLSTEDRERLRDLASAAPRPGHFADTGVAGRFYDAAREAVPALLAALQDTERERDAATASAARLRAALEEAEGRADRLGRELVTADEVTLNAIEEREALAAAILRAAKILVAIEEGEVGPLAAVVARVAEARAALAEGGAEGGE